MKRTIAIAAMVAVAAFGTAFTGYSYHVKNHHALVPDPGTAMPAKIVTTVNTVRNKVAPVAFAGKQRR